MTFNKETFKRRCALFIFWAWHVIYTLIAVFLFTPLLIGPLLSGALTDSTPWHYLLCALIMVALPFASMYLGVRYFHKDFRMLMKYFYGFEMPLLFFLLVRVFTFRDSGWAVTWLMLVVSLALVAWLVFLLAQLRTHNADVPLRNDWRGMVGSTLLAGVGIYFGSIFLIIQLPNAVEFIHELGIALMGISFEHIGQLFWGLINPLWWLFGLFLLFTFTLFLVLPLAMIYLYIRQFLQRLPSLLTLPRMVLVALVIMLNVVILYFTTQQPQQQVFSLLEDKQNTDQAALSKQSAFIREGLLNAYLARYRYLSTADLSKRIQHNYRKTFNVSPETAAIPQTIFNTLLKPFLYEGESWEDKQRAAKHYAEFFDTPIQKAERDLIVETLKHTWEAGADNEAGLLDAANHYVHLDQQDINIEVQHNVATVTVEQTLRNLTRRPKETVLHFALPEDAVLTGVWLSDEVDRPLKYPYALSPKGAAQSVYKAEVRRRIDPALLEQTGPYQYRLRVYPVPAKRTDNTAAEPLYARFSYQTLADAQGNWPMPTVLEKRNVFWDKSTKYAVNGKKLRYHQTANSFPVEPLAAGRRGQTNTLSYQVDGQTLLAIPRRKDQEKLPDHVRFAVLIDGSYSMREHYPLVQQTLTRLKASNVRFNSYFCQDECRAFNDTNRPAPTFFGNSQTPQHLSAFSRHTRQTNYNAIIVLSDAGSYELSDTGNKTAHSLNQPLWLVHLDGLLPYAYDDKLLDTLYRSGGGIAASADEALRRYQLFAQGGRINAYADTGMPDDVQLISVSDQYLWFAAGSGKANKRPAGIAAAHWLRYLMRTLDTDKLETLDLIHRIAKRENIVSHYSSMLVLVNDRQKEALKKAEQGDDRFEREVETGRQSTTQPHDPFAVPAVPEPEEWALIIITLVFLSYSLWCRRRQPMNVITGHCRNIGV